MLTNAFRLVHDRSGTVAATFALAMIPAFYLVGVGIDYTKAAQRQQQLNAIADAAALAAVTPAAMAQGDAQSILAAQSMFNSQAAAIPGLAYDPANLSVTVQDAGLKRTVAVSYQAGSRTCLRPFWARHKFHSAAFPKPPPWCRRTSISTCCSTTRRQWPSPRPQPT
jgi:Flp pilus assembly protein TadG